MHTNQLILVKPTFELVNSYYLWAQYEVKSTYLSISKGCMCVCAGEMESVCATVPRLLAHAHVCVRVYLHHRTHVYRIEQSEFKLIRRGIELLNISFIYICLLRGGGHIFCNNKYKILLISTHLSRNQLCIV